MRLLVCGSREFNDYDRLKEVLLETYHRPGTNGGHSISCIISGHARGADSLAERFAKEFNIPVEIYPADWDSFGKAAGPIRNAQMLAEGRVGEVCAFLKENSIGTRDMIEKSIHAGKPVKVVNI